MGSLGLRVRNGDRDILVPFRHARGGFCWSGSHRVVRREEERRRAKIRVGGGDGDAVCNDPKTGSFRDDDLLFYPCLMVREVEGQEIAGSEIEFSLTQKNQERRVL